MCHLELLGLELGPLERRARSQPLRRVGPSGRPCGAGGLACACGVGVHVCRPSCGPFAQPANRPSLKPRPNPLCLVGPAGPSRSASSHSVRALQPRRCGRSRRGRQGRQGHSIRGVGEGRRSGGSGKGLALQPPPPTSPRARRAPQGSARLRTARPRKAQPAQPRAIKTLSLTLLDPTLAVPARQPPRPAPFPTSFPSVPCRNPSFCIFSPRVPRRLFLLFSAPFKRTNLPLPLYPWPGQPGCGSRFAIPRAPGGPEGLGALGALRPPT